MNERTIDALDMEILNILQENARISNAEISRRVGKAPSAVLERIRKLEKKGVILGYEPKINHKLLGLGLTSFTFVKVEEGPGSYDTGRQLASFPEVLEVHYTAGQDSYLVKVRVDDTEALQETLAKFGTVDAVKDTRSTIVLRTVKETRNVSLFARSEEKSQEE